jgi:hypothetical protein
LLDAYATPQNYDFDEICLFPRAGHQVGGDRDERGPKPAGGVRDGVG